MVFGHSTCDTGGHFSADSPQVGKMLLVFQAEEEIPQVFFNYRNNQISFLVFCWAYWQLYYFLLHLPLNTVNATSIVDCHLYKYNN